MILAFQQGNEPLDKMRKLGLGISFFLIATASLILCLGYFYATHSGIFIECAVYLYASAAFFASPYMVIMKQREDQHGRDKLDALLEIGSSGFYALALIALFIMAIPYIEGISVNENTGTPWQTIAQGIVAVSFIFNLLLHCVSALLSAKLLFAALPEKR